MEFFTVGVYGLSSEEFFKKLISNNIDTFIDVRRRRAVRGSRYSFVNSKRLQKMLAEIKIRYVHILDLAPTNTIRDLQKKNDEELGINKKDRDQLSPPFISAYEEQILDNYRLSDLIKGLKTDGVEKAVLFCVEKNPWACHRSLIAKRIKEEFSIQTYDL